MTTRKTKPKTRPAATIEAVERRSPWTVAHRFDRHARTIADRHYNRQKPGTPQFVPPGRCLVLVTATALWVSSWQFPQYVKHDWPGAWVCSCFRNEGKTRASDLNMAAVAATRAHWGESPRIPSKVGPVGFVSFIDREKVQPTKVRGVPVWGYSWRVCGWEEIGETRGGLLAMGLRPERMPAPCAANRECDTHLFAGAPHV